MSIKGQTMSFGYFQIIIHHACRDAVLLCLPVLGDRKQQQKKKPWACLFLTGEIIQLLLACLKLTDPYVCSSPTKHCVCFSNKGPLCYLLCDTMAISMHYSNITASGIPCSRRGGLDCVNSPMNFT